MAKAIQLTDEHLQDKQGTYTVPLRSDNGDVLKVRVKIKGMKRRYGRVDLLVTPIAGSGEAWVSWKHVSIDGIDGGKCRYQ